MNSRCTLFTELLIGPLGGRSMFVCRNYELLLLPGNITVHGVCNSCTSTVGLSFEPTFWETCVTREMDLLSMLFAPEPCSVTLSVISVFASVWPPVVGRATAVGKREMMEESPYMRRRPYICHLPKLCPIDYQPVDIAVLHFDAASWFVKKWSLLLNRSMRRTLIIYMSQRKIPSIGKLHS